MQEEFYEGSFAYLKSVIPWYFSAIIPAIKNKSVMLMKNIRYITNVLIGNSKLLFPLVVPRSRKAVITPKSDICIAGPPRSANTYAMHVFRLWNPDLLIAHHVHQPMQIIFAVKWNVPCIVLLRDPIDTIASLIIVDPKLSITLAIWSYIIFYNKIFQVKEKLVVATFERIIEKFDNVICEVNGTYNTSFSYEKLTKCQTKKIFNVISEHRKQLNKYPLLVAVPDQAKERKKIMVKMKIEKNPLYPVARSVYDKWLSFAKD